MRWLELKVPPVAVSFIGCGLMWALSFLAPSLPVALPWRALGAVAFMAASLGIGLAGVRRFGSRHTTVNPMTPERTTELVTDGVYRMTRNPMYLGMLCGLLAVASLLASPVSLVVVPLFALYLDRFQIAPEERAMRELFGEEYERYRSRVRRWV